MSHEERAREIKDAIETKLDNDCGQASTGVPEIAVTWIAQALKDEESKWEKRVAVLVDALDEAENDIASMSDTLMHCYSNGCVPTNHEYENSLVAVKAVRKALAAYRAMEKGNDENT